MEDRLIELLSTFGIPIIRQGSLTGDYPSDFFTFWNSGADNLTYYDNTPIGVAWTFDVNRYSNNPQNTYDGLQQAITLLKANGFLINSRGHDVASDEETHTGRGFETTIIEHI